MVATLVPLKKPPGGALRLERSYNFIDKKPVIDELRTLVGDTPLKKLAEESDVSLSTLRSWFDGKTIGPRTITINKVARLYRKRIGLVDL